MHPSGCQRGNKSLGQEGQAKSECCGRAATRAWVRSSVAPRQASSSSALPDSLRSKVDPCLPASRACLWCTELTPAPAETSEEPGHSEDAAFTGKGTGPLPLHPGPEWQLLLGKDLAMGNTWGWQRGSIPAAVTERLREVAHSCGATGLPGGAPAPKDRALGVTPAHHILTFPESALRGVLEKGGWRKRCAG